MLWMFYFEIQRMKGKSNKGSELASYEIELRNQVTQNDTTLPVTNSKIFIEIILSSYWLDFIKY